MPNASSLLAALLLGFAGALGQNGPPPSFGYGRGSGRHPKRTFRTKNGGRMQGFRCKKARNLKGQSR